MTFEELGEEGLRIMIEKDPEYSPLTDEELETYEYVFYGKWYY